mgnify:CR=1 FL=1
MKIQESAENYLEAILILKQNKGSVRSIDIAHYLNFSKPSVSIAMKNLRNSDMITVDSDGFISLTELVIRLLIRFLSAILFYLTC